MVDLRPINEAPDLFRQLLSSRGMTSANMVADTAWQTLVDFANIRFATGPQPASDGLLYEYGTYRFTGRSMFTLDLVRQFETVDEGGEHDHFVQFHCELRYEPEPALDALGAFDSWWFPDQGLLEEWTSEINSRPEWTVLATKVPSEVEIHQEQV
jgi:hypothetical protein